jgi:hypothetical protein
MGKDRYGQRGDGPCPIDRKQNIADCAEGFPGDRRPAEPPDQIGSDDDFKLPCDYHEIKREFAALPRKCQP